MAEPADDLLGGYATSTLTQEEQKRLFAAALEDQDLFDKLVDEDVLREAFDDAPTRASVLGALNEIPKRSFLWSLVSLQAGAVVAVMLTAGLGVLVYRQYDIPTVVPGAGPDRVAATAPSTPSAPDSPRAAAPATLETWLGSASIAANESVFRPALEAAPSDVSPKGIPKRGSEVGAQMVFVADRTGHMAIFTVSDDGRITRMSDWRSVEAGESRPLSTSLSSDVREVRVVIVDRDETIDDDADAIAAIEGGRGAVYALRVQRQ